MNRINTILSNVSPTLFTAMGIKLAFILAAYLWSFDILRYFENKYPNQSQIINYAPEVWLSLLALVLGTLIIVISIAAESTPTLIDLFVKDVRSRLFIWLMVLSMAENIFLQLKQTQEIIFYNNLIFFNSYLLLPLFCIFAIPYIYYILSYTKDSNVIRKIFEQNSKAIKEAVKIKTPGKIEKNHFTLFETINQLNDLHQYIQFKEPKGSIINMLGDSLRLYLSSKMNFSSSYFKLNIVVKEDISFKMLSAEFDQLEREHTFYERKVLRSMGTSYLLLIKDSHYDLASLCGSELFKTGEVAFNLKDEQGMKLILVHFNTLIRYGINHGLKTKEFRNVNNIIFHYRKLVKLFVVSKQQSMVSLCFKYFCFYTSEVSRLALQEPLFIILVDAFTAELKEILMEVYVSDFQKESQESLLEMFNKPSFVRDQLFGSKNTDSSGFRTLQIAMCLFYVSKGEYSFCDSIVDAIIRDFGILDEEKTIEILNRDCERIQQEAEEFWEETDRGNKNMYYSAHVDQMPAFKARILSTINNTSRLNLIEVEKNIELS